MDLSFPVERLKPTRPPAPPDSPRRLSPDQVTLLVQQLAAQTRAIQAHPYKPDTWFERAGTLEALGYPELAVGDAWKAEQLGQSMLALSRYRRGGQWRLGHAKGFWMQDETFGDEALEKETDRLMDQLRTLIAKPRMLMHAILSRDLECREGRFVPQEYPWLSEAHHARSDTLIADINQELSRNAIRSPAGKAYCKIKRCSFGPIAVVEAKAATAIGMFATCNVRKGTKILIDRTDLFGCIGPSSSQTKLTGALCGHPLHPNTVDDEGTMDLRWVRERLGATASESLLVCRVLLACVRRGADHAAQMNARNHVHPLELPEIARSMPTYHQQLPQVFSLDHDIAVPNEALQHFGVDIYADQHFDTWVLFTIAARLDNNSWSTPTCAVLNPLFSLFNHSCDPNVDWKSSNDHRTIKMTTKRDVAKDEQLFVEYDSFEHKKPLAQRRERLSRWIDGPCLCSRCVREERELKSGKLVGQDHLSEAGRTGDPDLWLAGQVPSWHSETMWAPPEGGSVFW